MTTTTLHTPLEELLFFQSLRTYGPSRSSFAKISAVLNENEFVRSDEGYNADRLTTTSLQQLYLDLLKDEINSKRQPSPENDVGPSSKKRKLSPPPQSIEEASKHTHLIPSMVSRLYLRYRDHVVQAIHHEEKLYWQTLGDLRAIERGEWDGKLKEEEASRNNSHNGAVQSLLQHETEQANALDSKVQADGSALIQKSAQASEGQQPNVSSSNGRSGLVPSAGSNNQQPTGNAQVQSSPHPQGLPLSQTHTKGQNTGTPPVSDVQHRPPQANPSPRPVLQSSASQSEKSSGSPATLPAPPASSRTSHSPAGPLDSLANLSAQPYRPPFQPSPHQGQSPSLPPLPSSLPQPHTLPPRPFQPYEGQGQYPPQYPPYGQPPVPPFHSPHPSQPTHQFATPNQAFASNVAPGSQGRHQPSPVGYGAFQGFPLGQQQSPQHPVYMGNQTYPAHTTPVPNSANRRLQSLASVNTSVSSTKWKSSHRPPKGIPRSPSPPPRSPYLPSSPEPSPEPEERDVPALSGDRRLGRGRENAAARGEATPSRGRGRGRWAGHTARGRGGQLGNPSSSTHRTSKEATTRSPSAVSHTDELSMDAFPRRKIKPEPSTPLPQTDDTSAISTPGSTARPTGRRNTLRTEIPRPGVKRKRANTMEVSPEPNVPHTPYLPTRPNHVLATRNFSKIAQGHLNTISLHKNADFFAKAITEKAVPGYQSLIYRPQDINSIRSAAKNGTRAIVAIDRAAAAAAESSSVAASADEAGGGAASPPSTTAANSTSKGATLWVERTADVIPPKGIVNSTQLEKEFSRMFANAVMFNPDPARGFGPTFLMRRHDGTEEDEETAPGGDGHYEVEDDSSNVTKARMMFADVERELGGMRAVESTALDRSRGEEGRREESEADELADQTGEEVEPRGRSRRG